MQCEEKSWVVAWKHGNRAGSKFHRLTWVGRQGLDSGRALASSRNSSPQKAEDVYQRAHPVAVKMGGDGCVGRERATENIGQAWPRRASIGQPRLVPRLKAMSLEDMPVQHASVKDVCWPACDSPTQRAGAREQPTVSRLGVVTAGLVCGYPSVASCRPMDK